MTNAETRVSLQLWLGTVIPMMVVTPPACNCAHMRGRGPDGALGLADIHVRGHYDMRCPNTSSEKLRRHNWIVRSLQSGLDLLRIQSTMTSVLRLARRSLPDGTPDPTDRSQQQPDLAIYDHHRGGANPTLVDALVTDPTAPTYRTTSSRRVGAAAARAEARKHARYSRQSLESVNAVTFT